MHTHLYFVIVLYSEKSPHGFNFNELILQAIWYKSAEVIYVGWITKYPKVKVLITWVNCVLIVDKVPFKMCDLVDFHFCSAKKLLDSQQYLTPFYLHTIKVMAKNKHSWNEWIINISKMKELDTSFELQVNAYGREEQKQIIGLRGMQKRFFCIVMLPWAL